MDSKGLKERITSGLIVWVLVTIFIQPILSFTWKAIVAVVGFVHQGYLDRIYRSAAFMGPSAIELFTLIMLFIVAALLWLFWLQRIWESDPVSVHFPRFFKKSAFLGVTMGALLGGFCVLAIIRGTVVINQSFTQRLTVLAPSISDMEYKTLKARWAGMQGKTDYDALFTEMDRRATQLGVKLPPVRKP